MNKDCFSVGSVLKVVFDSGFRRGYREAMKKVQEDAEIFIQIHEPVLESSLADDGSQAKKKAAKTEGLAR